MILSYEGHYFEVGTLQLRALTLFLTLEAKPRTLGFGRRRRYRHLVSELSISFGEGSLGREPTRHS